MEKEIKLLPSQVEKIKETLEEINEKYKSLIEVYKGTSVGSILGNQGFSDVVDSGYTNTITNLERKKEELEKILKVANIIKEYNEESISIGTRFAATCDYDGEIETDEYVLVSTKEGSKITKNRTDNDAICVTTDSPFGRAVLGKRIGDPIYYETSGMHVVGFIEDITPKEKMEESIQKVK